MTNTIHRRMSDTSVVIAIAVSCAAIVVIFFAAICFCHWRSRPKSPTGTRSRDHDDSDANSDVEMDAIPDDALNHPLVRGSNERDMFIRFLKQLVSFMLMLRTEDVEGRDCKDGRSEDQGLAMRGKEWLARYCNNNKAPNVVVHDL